MSDRKRLEEIRHLAETMEHIEFPTSDPWLALYSRHVPWLLSQLSAAEEREREVVREIVGVLREGGYSDTANYIEHRFLSPETGPTAEGKG